MPAIIHPKKHQPQVISKLRNMTPYEVYKLQITSIMDAIRTTQRGLTYFPPQIGGLDGQRDAIREKVALQLIEFEVQGGN